LIWLQFPAIFFINRIESSASLISVVKLHPQTADLNKKAVNCMNWLINGGRNLPGGIPRKDAKGKGTRSIDASLPAPWWQRVKFLSAFALCVFA
jgi:hypothetical protein